MKACAGVWAKCRFSDSRLRILPALLGALVAAGAVQAAPTSLEQARAAARGWAADSRHVLTEDFADKAMGKAWSHLGLDGQPVFHCIGFEGGGYVVTAADDGLFPVVAFSDSGTLEADERDPLWALLVDDMPRRLAYVQEREVAQATNPAPLAATPDRMAENQAAWRELTGDGPVPLGLSTLPDVRVSPLVQSTWSQSEVGSYDVYNYYTPNNYVCGCVATAMAQVMRFHQFPTGSVTARTKTCYVDGASRSLTMVGGVYAWSNMPLSPSTSITLAQRQAIGKLTYDAGVSVCMQYSSGSSGANGGMACIAFADVFGYANARGYTAPGGIDAAMIERAILANLDAGFPVMLGISGSAGGHAVVGDGYGYSGATRYVHLNMGWSGSQNAWYNLPTVDDDWYGFTSLDSVVYNVYPSGGGELITGRVTNNSGTPLAGATVTASRSGASFTATTGSGGIYAVRVDGGYAYTVTATHSGSSQSTSVSVSSSSSTSYYEPNLYYPGTGSIGNSWGNNIAIAPASTPSAPSGLNAADGSSTANVGVSWSASSGATSYSVWRGTSSSSASATSIASGLTSTSHNDTSATPGALYYYWVKASNSAGTSGFSSSNTGYRGLSVPGGVSATDGTSTTQVTVTWNAVTGASHYRVYRATSSGGTKTALGSWQTARSYADTSATAGTTYYYFVAAAVDSSGIRSSAYSSYNTGYRAVVTIPAPPTGVAAADGSSTANVAVTWTASSGATSYSVWRGTSSSSGSAASIASGLTSTSHNDTSATPGVRFYYWVKATNAAGTSGFSSSDTGYRKLAAPTVSATTTDPTKVRVSWSAPAGASFYRVSRATTSTGAKTVVSTGWQSALSFDDATAAVGTTFYYFVEAAVDSAGARPSAYSAYATGSRPLPPNNAFASATAISGPTGSVNGPTEGATKEAGEPEHNGEATAVNSVWWAWTAPYSGMATFDTVGSAFDTVLAVYTGTSVGALTAVASNDDAVGLVSRVSFNATGGTVYRIAVAGYGGASGRAVLNWSLVSPIEPTIKSAGITTSAGTLYFQMTFKTKAGKTYNVLRKDTLASPSWTTVSTVSATADGLKSVSIAIPSNKPAGYYRVKTTE